MAFDRVVAPARPAIASPLSEVRDQDHPRRPHARLRGNQERILRRVHGSTQRVKGRPHAKGNGERRPPLPNPARKPALSPLGTQAPCVTGSESRIDFRRSGSAVDTLCGMRTVIALVTALSTVLHLAVGCCLHAAHFDGFAAGAHGQHAACNGAPCEAGHTHDSTSLRADVDCGSYDSNRVGEAHAPTHLCDGCDCPAMVQERVAQDWMTACARSPAVFCGDVILVSQATRGACGPSSPPPFSGPRTLFERLLI